MKVSASIFVGLLCTAGFAQEKSPSILDPSGYVTKYDVDFAGIGPEVYVLPAPRSKAELLMDSYRNKQSFGETIDRSMDLQRLWREFLYTANSAYIRDHFSSTLQEPTNWKEAIGLEKEKGRTDVLIGLLNEYAFTSLKQGRVDQAVDILVGAMEDGQKNKATPDMIAIQSNLAGIYMYNRNFEEASRLQEALLHELVAKGGKSTIEQADAWVRLSLIQAYRQEYVAAENSIIRKAIPLYNRGKEYGKKVIAWKKLARIYQMFGKHTEAQWFLIQAHQLAESKQLFHEIAEIEYLLGFSKLKQKNYAVAVAELQNAAEMAHKEKDEILELAAYDKLGEVYMALAQYEKAEQVLSQYWHLRNKLF